MLIDSDIGIGTASPLCIYTNTCTQRYICMHVCIKESKYAFIDMYVYLNIC